jgi:hypothetical protein
MFFLFFQMSLPPSLVQTVYTTEGARYLIHLKSNGDAVWIIDDEGRVYSSQIDRDKLAAISKVIVEGKASIEAEVDETLTVNFDSVAIVNAKLEESLEAGKLLAHSFHDLLASKRILLDENSSASQAKPNVQYVYVNSEKIETRKKKPVKVSASLTSARTGM